MPLNLEIGHDADVNIPDAWLTKANGTIRVANGCRLYLGDPIHIDQEFTSLHIDIRNGGSLALAERCYWGRVSIVCQGGAVTIETETTCNIVNFRAFEGQSIKIGRDCMLGADIEIDTSDFHTIYDLETGQIMNPGKGVMIGSHVWIANGCGVLKGATIGDGSVIGAKSLVTGAIPAKCVAAGVPARVIRSNVGWSRTSPDQYIRDV